MYNMPFFVNFFDDDDNGGVLINICQITAILPRENETRIFTSGSDDSWYTIKKPIDKVLDHIQKEIDQRLQNISFSVRLEANCER